jgi:MFS family permease
MIAADLLRALLLVSVPLAATVDLLTIEQLYAVAFLTGALTVVFDVSYQSYLPSLLRHDQLLEGNSKLTASASVAEVGAFGLAGWLVQLLTAPFAILIDAATFVVSAVSLLLIRTPEPAPAPVESRQSVRREVAEGVRAVLSDGILRALAASAATEALARGIIGATILLYLNREVGFSPGVLGMIFAVGGVSSFFGAVLAERVTRRLGLGPALILSLVLTGAGSLMIPLASAVSLLAAALLIVNQLITDPAATVNDIAAVSLRQAIAPARLLGRVNGSIRFAVLLSTLAGTLLAGLLAERVGLRPTLLVGAGLNLLAAGWLVLSPVLGMVRAPHMVSEATDEGTVAPVAESCG